MSSTASPLEYANPAPPRRRFFHVILLPLLWLPAGIGSRIYYGDEYSAFAVAHIPAWVLFMFLEQHVELPTLLLLGIIFNFALMLMAGLLMDLLRIPRRAWLLFPPLLLALVFCYLRYGRPTQYHAEWLSFTWAWSTYLFAAASLVLTPLLRLFPRLRSPRP